MLVSVDAAVTVKLNEAEQERRRTAGRDAPSLRR